MKRNEIKSIIESMLFVWGDPLNISDISNILELEPRFIRDCILELKKEYYDQDRGIQIMEINDSFQFCTNKKNFSFLEKLCTPIQKNRLTEAALEVLAIIAYRQPIIKSDIEEIRGVRCDKTISTLLEKGLITEKGRMERLGRPILYGTTDEFLKLFGLRSLKELPPLAERPQY